MSAPPTVVPPTESGPTAESPAAVIAPTLLAGVPPPPGDLALEARRSPDGPAAVRGRSAGRIRRSGKLSRGLGLFAAAVAVLVLIGWVAHNDVLKGLAPGKIAM